MFRLPTLGTSASVITDGLCCFQATAMIGASHERVVTGGGQASVELPQFKAINTLLGTLKTAINGTYHAFGFAKYAHRYRADFQYCFNRRFNMRTLLNRLLHAMAAPAPPEHALRCAEVDRQSRFLFTSGG